MQNPFFIGWPWWTLIAGLVVFAALLAARAHRASLLLARIAVDVPAELRFANAIELARRVAARFRHIEEHGPVGNAARWPFRTDADHLLTGGDCGNAAAIVGAVFISRGRPFRMVQVNLVEAEASHIMVETQDDALRWVLIDPLTGLGFPRPLDGRFLGIDEIRALPPEERGWLAQAYRDGEWSLFTPYRRTNWARLGPLAGVVRAVAGDEWMREVSLRALLLEASSRLVECAPLAIALAQGRRARRRLPGPESETFVSAD